MIGQNFDTNSKPAKVLMVIGAIVVILIGLQMAFGLLAFMFKHWFISLLLGAAAYFGYRHYQNKKGEQNPPQ